MRNKLTALCRFYFVWYSTSSAKKLGRKYKSKERAHILDDCTFSDFVEFHMVVFANEVNGQIAPQSYDDEPISLPDF